MRNAAQPPQLPKPPHPPLRVIGAAQAIDFYTQAFGAVKRFRLTEPSGRVGHDECRSARWC